MSRGCDGGAGGGSVARHPGCVHVHVLAVTFWFRQALAPSVWYGAHGICLGPYKPHGNWRLSQNKSFTS